MELETLTSDEQLALVALIKMTVMADGNVSQEEVEELQDIVEEIGEDKYTALSADSEKKFKNEAALKKFLETIKREDAREIIYGTVMDLAAIDIVASEESELLSWLGKAWNLEMHVGAEDDE